MCGWFGVSWEGHAVPVLRFRLSGSVAWKGRNGVLRSSLWRRFFGLDERTVVEDVGFDVCVPELLVAQVRPKRTRDGRGRCGRCGRLASWYDGGRGRRRWRALDLGVVVVELEADAPRVKCPVHGPTVIAVPWARHDAGHTRDFDDMVAWLAVACSKTAVAALMRVAWRTVGGIVRRVCADMDAAVDRFAGLRRIGIDEISYRKGYKYLTVVVDHDTGRLVWAAPGRDRVTLRAFFEILGAERCRWLTHVSADGAPWIADVVAERAPQAVLCADPFHVIGWATEALDEVRRTAWNDARRAAGNDTRTTAGGRRINLSRSNAKKFKGSRYALWKNPEDLTENQHAKLAWIAKTDPRLYRAYLLKEGLRHVFKIKGEAGKQALNQWLSWAQRCRIPLFVDLARKIRKHLTAIHATLHHGLSNGLIESVNTKIRVLTRIAYGFQNPHTLIALALLALGGYRPTLPGR
jgi:transposase